METPHEQPEAPEDFDPKEVGGEFSILEFLAASGVTQKQLADVVATLSALVPKLLDEIVKDTWRYAKEDKDLLAFKKLHMTEMRDMMVMSATSSRGFLLALTTLSVTVIGALFAKSDFATLRDNVYILAGCASLAVSVVVSIGYLSHVHVSEHDSLRSISWKQRKQVFELRKLLRTMHDKSQRYDAYSAAKSSMMAQFDDDEAVSFKEAPKSGGLLRWMHVASGTFLAGLVLVAVGFMMR